MRKVREPRAMRVVASSSVFSSSIKYGLLSTLLSTSSSQLHSSRQQNHHAILQYTSKARGGASTELLQPSRSFSSQVVPVETPQDLQQQIPLPIVESVAEQLDKKAVPIPVDPEWPQKRAQLHKLYNFAVVHLNSG